MLMVPLFGKNVSKDFDDSQTYCYIKENKIINELRYLFCKYLFLYVLLMSLIKNSKETVWWKKLYTRIPKKFLLSAENIECLTLKEHVTENLDL